MKKHYPQLSVILKRLLFQKDIRCADLARAVDLPLPTVHRLVTGKCTRPYPSSINPIADYFNVTTEQLLGLQPLPTEHSSDEALAHNASLATMLNDFKMVPLRQWDTLDQENPATTGQLAVGNVSQQSFALIMPDHSMEPLFEKDCTLIFDPAIGPIDRSYVLIRTSTAFLFRQLLIDADQRYIKSLNPDTSATSIRLLTPQDHIVACLVESRNSFLKNA